MKRVLLTAYKVVGREYSKDQCDASFGCLLWLDELYAVAHAANANLYLHMTVTNPKAHWLLWLLYTTK